MTPIALTPVLAEIEHQGCLGLSLWFEVVYFDDDPDVGGWKSYHGSRTFDDGEKVTGWRYCHEIEMQRAEP